MRNQAATTCIPGTSLCLQTSCTANSTRPAVVSRQIPICQRRAVCSTLPRLRCKGLTVIRLEVFHREPEERRKGYICPWIRRRLAIEESADEGAHLLRRESTHTHGGA